MAWVAGTEPEYLPKIHNYRYHYADVAKVELVCADHEVERFVNVLQEVFDDDANGEGRIFVLNVETAVVLGNGSKP